MQDWQDLQGLQDLQENHTFLDQKLEYLYDKGGRDTILCLTELSLGCLTMLIGLTASNFSKFKFEIIIPKAISDKGMRLSLFMKKFTYFSSSWKSSMGVT